MHLCKTDLVIFEDIKVVNKSCKSKKDRQFIGRRFGLVLWCLKLHSKIVHLYCGGQFHWWRRQEYREKTTDLPHVTDKLYHRMSYTSPWAGFDLTTSVVEWNKSQKDKYDLQNTKQKTKDKERRTH